MKILKVLVIIVLVIIAVPLIIALFVKKEYAISRSIVINKPTPEVYEYVSKLENQDHFSKWNRSDPAKKKTVSGTDGTIGFIYAWDSEKKEVGKGQQEIKNLEDGKKVGMEIRFEKPFESVIQASFVTELIANGQTTVTWAINGRNAYPVNVMNLFVPQLLGKDIDTSLSNLKTVLEKQ